MSKKGMKHSATSVANDSGVGGQAVFTASVAPVSMPPCSVKMAELTVAGA
jgi:hypothetical protein